MESFAILQKGLVLGFALAAPIGPISILIIERTLSTGRGVGLASGLGAAAADSLYALGGALATSLVASVVARGAALEVAGAALLAVLAAHGLHGAIREGQRGRGVCAGHGAAPDPARHAPRAGNAARAFASTLALTLASPISLVSFAALSAALGVGTAAAGERYGAVAGAALLATSVGAGSMLWWLILVGGVGLFEQRIGPSARRGIRIASGAILALFAVVMVARHVGPWGSR
jgi:threonine/homoserine/homoserine lactone efflux protein